MSSSIFAIRYVGVWAGGLLLCVMCVWRWQSLREAPPPEFALGGFVSVVSIKATNGKYLEVSEEDGMLRATASTSSGLAAKFRVHVLSAGTASALRIAAASVAPWSTEKGSTTTVQGCKCSGFSNEHGFGRFCHPWETDMQAPWCYVDDSCAGASGGSFGRKHGECPQLGDFGRGGGGTLSNNATTSTAGAAEAGGEEIQPSDLNSAIDPPSALVWRPPTSCPCSGRKSALGYGGSCKGWEFEGQTPWCYVYDNCSLASAKGRPGSFGHRFLDCVLQGGEEENGDRVIEEARRTSAPRRLSSVAAPKVAPKVASVKVVAPDEDALLERVERLKQPYVALVSLATEGFVSVELPPHRLALQAHARTDALSLKGVFSFLSSGAILSLSTNALLNLCGEAVNSNDSNHHAPLSLGAAEASAFSASAATAAAARASVCTGYLEPGVAHPKLLRSAADARRASQVGTREGFTGTFKVERHARQAAPKLQAKPLGRSPQQ